MHTKLRRVKIALAQWRKKTFGNIFPIVALLKDVVKAKEIQLKFSHLEDTKVSLNEVEVDLKRYLHIGEEFWR